MHPVDAPITQDFGSNAHWSWQLGFGHLGMDYGCPAGTPVRTIAPGTVIYAGPNLTMPYDIAWENYFYQGADFAGNVVVIQHDGWRSISAHLESWAISTGQRVQRSQIIGRSGWTGNVIPKGPGGAHLHFETYVTPNPGVAPFGRFNPLPQIAEEDRLAGGAINVIPAGEAPTRPLLIPDTTQYGAGIPDLFADA
ncbi:murein DD-endopeptidase MepM/ murein hydrolase activator NlpD [Arthrobacter sp. UYP6]|uniref:M23 family metallopeptidase n=1 Tax=Arthrobacter sp. UYP6 TaxID=1756378 RepID=UPI00339837EC